MVYDSKQIAKEIELTALGNCFYGNSLRVVKDFPCVSPGERVIIDNILVNYKDKKLIRKNQDVLFKIAKRVKGN